jgi:hypothetical protein
MDFYITTETLLQESPLYLKDATASYYTVNKLGALGQIIAFPIC